MNNYVANMPHALSEQEECRPYCCGKIENGLFLQWLFQQKTQKLFRGGTGIVAYLHHLPEQQAAFSQPDTIS
ncbi:MAG: hypothetical protein LBB66_06195 [Desulfovibrio sp.]|nr:hypothetical protein [Desulfovibrio sp.]